MMTLRRSEDRGHADHGWLQSAHSFSFAGYFDPEHTGWGNLLVINEDHRDMEIISYVLEGELAHRDSLGHVETIPPGDVQRMSAGTGVRHSEFNHARDRTTHFLQIWIRPSQDGIEPGYEQKTVPPQAKRGRLALVASPEGGVHAVRIHADAALHAGLFDGAEQATLALDSARKAYVHLVRGELAVNGQALRAGDALKIEGESALRLCDGRQAEVLVFDLAP